MASRMERYYRAKDGVKKRSQLNQNLYREIYDIGEYSNIEGIAEIDKNNEIDITKVKKMLKNREDYNNQKEYRKLDCIFNANLIKSFFIIHNTSSFTV